MKTIIRKLKISFYIVCTVVMTSCSDYLDIVPDDGLATLESAFSLRSEAQRYLFTCYGFMPSEGNLDSDAGYMTGDELWSIIDRRESGGTWGGTLFNIARGLQNASSPYANDWGGIYEGIRCCNILLENAVTVPDLPDWERVQWEAEAKFLKAWYHFHLMRKWGPIPIIKENLSINASIDKVRVARDPIDECFDYVIELLTEAIPDLPLNEQSREELGRITRPIAASIKAKIMVYAASPLFNNNTDQTTLANRDGTKLFDTAKTPEQIKARWDAAVIACKEAIDICEQANFELYSTQSRVNLNDTLKMDLTLRCSVTEQWNSEIIWSNTHTGYGANQNLQMAASPNLEWSKYPDMPGLYSHINPPLKVAEMFYTNHGLPIENDLAWDTINPIELKAGDDAHRWYLRKDYVTAKLNFNREPRFYAWLGFDGGIWYGGPNVGTNDPIPGDLLWVACRYGGAQQKKGYDWGPVTGYFIKKVVNYINRQTSATGYSCLRYHWPLLRLPDLYLLYAEAINESEGPNGAHSNDLFTYIDMVRAKAALPGVKEAWDTYSDNPGRYNTQTGMRQIIHRERLIELSFEGQRFWDLRRWKEAPAEYAKGLEGYKITASRAEDYYQRVVLADQKFSLKDYFWPIQVSIIEQNPNLIQNIGW